MNEQDYERMVARLEERYDNSILATAVGAIDPDGDYDEQHDAAHEAVVEDLLNDPRWEKVEAADISDIAYEAATRAWSQHRAWEEV